MNGEYLSPFMQVELRHRGLGRPGHSQQVRQSGSGSTLFFFWSGVEEFTNLWTVHTSEDSMLLGKDPHS